MSSQRPSTNRERETLLLLRDALPEYEINPHMRLANVVKGKVPYSWALGQYELDFVVQDPATGAVICAIELDDSTHDTEDGRRRDANKNRWMSQAGIKLIRIRKPSDAITIRESMNQPIEHTIEYNIPETIERPYRERVNQPIEHNMPWNEPYLFEKKPGLSKAERSILSALIVVIGAPLAIWLMISVVSHAANRFSSAVMETAMKSSQQNLARLQQQNAARVEQARLMKQQEMEQAEARRRVAAQQPHYERVLVKGKSARECSEGNVINNASVACMQDHYETVLVNGAK
jgi:very-short-patch-repair endonuclease